MSRLAVRPSQSLTGTCTVPGDKSITHRAVILGAMAEGCTAVEGFLCADDCLRTLRAVEALGVKSRWNGSALLIESRGYPSWRQPDGVLDLGNSGTGMRLLIGALAGRPMTVTLDGDQSLRRRPMDRLAIPLGMMGAQVEGQGERCTPPVTVRGARLRGIEYHTPVASAQVKSAILLAGVQAEGETAVIEPAKSRDHTERMLPAFGVPVAVDGLRVSLKGPAGLKPCHVRVPGDISSAAYILAAALLCPDSEVVIENVLANPTRCGFLEILEQMAADVRFEDVVESAGEPRGTLVARTSGLQAVQVGGGVIPRAIDELPLLAVLATQAEGETVVRDAAELRVKESDRIAATARALRAMGAQIEELDDGWVIRGPCKLRGAQVDAEMDHRIAMSMAVAGLVADGETIITGAEAVKTSFPDFADVLAGLGAKIQMVD